MIKVGIIGSTGYAGQELVRILLQHKEAEIIWYGSRSYVDQKFSSVFGNMFQIVEDLCKSDDLDTLCKEADVIFTATPQGYLLGEINEKMLNHCKVIDLSADFRIKEVEVYEKWYGIQHTAKQFLPEAVYGLPEVNKEAVKTARLIANPGCYPTCTFLSMYPLVKEGLIEMDSLITDAKSGTSGAGRGSKVDNLFCEVNENIKAYGVTSHRHTPEIEEQLSIVHGEKVTMTFTPHLIPMNRGILATSYASLKEGVTTGQVREAYEKAYEKEPFVRLLEEGVMPQTKWVEGSNYVDVNCVIDERSHRVVMLGAMDNVVKGAAGQAVQNMNLMFGLEETMGLLMVPSFP